MTRFLVIVCVVGGAFAYWYSYGGHTRVPHAPTEQESIIHYAQRTVDGAAAQSNAQATQ